MARRRRSSFGDGGRNRLYKNRDERVIAGVCAGIADYFAFDVTVTRVLVALAAIFFSPFIFLVYIVLALVLEEKPHRAPSEIDPEREAVAKRIRSEPHTTLRSVHYRFRELDQRLQRIEKYVISDRFRLDREFEGLRQR